MPTYKIHPAIGIARIGNSPTEFFIGPEKPLALLAPTGGFKDAACRIKRQAARFRVFEYPDDGSAPFEYVPSADDVITWQVSVAGNVGAAVSGSVSGSGARTLLEAATTNANFPSLILLAELRTESPGRLLVLGGFGWVNLTPMTGGNDDTCDGSVQVTIVTPSGTLTVAQAWVVCAPPKYAPQLESIVTLQDALEERVGAPSGVTSYTQHVYPILRRAASMRWLLKEANGHHTWDLTNVASIPRDSIFRRLKIPPGVTPPAGVTGGDMPALDRLTLTRNQYSRMQDFWSDTNFVDDWVGEPMPTPGEPTPPELDRAALEACVGGPLHSGIDVGRNFLDSGSFESNDPGRVRLPPPSTLFLRQYLEPGWPGDYLACDEWPVARPQSVRTGDGYSNWARDWQSGDDLLTREDLAAQWMRLGFVEKQFDGTYFEARCSDLRVEPQPIATWVLNRIRRFIDIVDPPPPDVGVLRQVAERIDEALAPARPDQLSEIVERLDTMNESELQAALLETRAAAARADAATQLIESKLKQKRRR